MVKSTDRSEDTIFDTVVLDDPDFLRQIVERALQRFLEAESQALEEDIEPCLLRHRGATEGPWPEKRGRDQRQRWPGHRPSCCNGWGGSTDVRSGPWSWMR